MRSRIGAEKEFRIAGNGCSNQCLAVRFALEHRQAVPVWPDAALEDGIAVVEQMMGGDGRCHGQPGILHKFCSVLRRDVLHDHLEFREALSQWQQHGVDEDFFTVEKVDFRIRHLAMHQQRQADALHFGQRVVGFPDIGQTGVGIGRRPGRVELDGLDEAGSGGLGDLAGRRVVSQVEGHERLEAGAGRQRGEDALTIGGSLFDGGDRRLEVGHDDGPAKLRSCMGEDGSQGFAVA